MTLPSVVKAVANLNKNLSGVVVMSPAEGEAVVQEYPAVGHVQPSGLERDLLA